MTDESTNPAPPPPSPAESTQGTTEPATVAFCQQCGRGLSVNTVRAVGSGIFCEPCAARYAAPFPESTPGAIPKSTDGASANGYTAVHAPAMATAAIPSRPITGEPNPVLAGFLGLIPGVGAMYNGQYAKGAVHLVIFVVLTSLADNLNWVLWWLVWGWIFYQAFEAYHTAQAKRDGLPLPDPFGWNDLGDRLGLSRTSPPASAPPGKTVRPVPGAPGAVRTSWGAAGAVLYTNRPAPPFPVEAVPTVATTAFDTAFVPMPGQVPSPLTDPIRGPIPPAQPLYPPKSHFTSTAPPPPHAPYAPEVLYSTQSEPQYNSTYTGVPLSSSASPATLSPGAQRLPFGAAWLIGLGVLFLIANLAPGWRLEARWLVPALLALVAFWIGGRRVEATLHNRSGKSAGDLLAALTEGLVGAALLLTLAILLALQNAYVVPLRHSWPAVLIVWGALLLMARARPTVNSPAFDVATAMPEMFPDNSVPPR